MAIRDLFDANKDIYRTIEKVIAYNVSHEERLLSEISEYVVTESIEEQFFKLLNNMQSAMEKGGGNETGVWVSGFYGSGKSSFTKYLGLAFDDTIQINGVRFRQHLQDRFKNKTTKALLNSVSDKFPAAVLMLDLASEQIAGSTMEEVSNVLYYKVLQWAGYSRNLKVAAFERKLKKDKRHEEFLKIFREDTGETWSDYRDDELVIDSKIPEIAHKMYPALFPTPLSFTTDTKEVVRFENDRVKEMIEIAREATKKEYIIFIIDEVGQYVGARPNLILNLDGLSKNLKNIGDGKVWIIGTAQQTLTEDDKSAFLNSPELYKLKDRFPIRIDLESNDIKEICYNRLLGKSPAGETLLGNLFDQAGQTLRHNTKLENAKYYGADFDKKTFIELYPFLPAHFDILLQLLGALAKSTGGLGLRSAIKVIQDILIERLEGREPIANQEVGWLANTVTIYDSMEKDIERAFRPLHDAVGKAKIRFPNSKIHMDICKTVCVLQILGNLPANLQNISSLMHFGVHENSRTEETKLAIDSLMSDTIVPFGEKEGLYCFLSEKLNSIEKEKSTLLLDTKEIKRIQSTAIRELYSPLPKVNLHGSLSVETGLKIQYYQGSPISLSGDRNTVQTIIEIVEPSEYENEKVRLIDESRVRSSSSVIFLIGRKNNEVQDIASEIFKCKEIETKYKSDPDQEVKDYCKNQSGIASRLTDELKRVLRKSFTQGALIFRGEITPIESLHQDLLESSNIHLNKVAPQVFDHYNEAPIRVGTDIAERFLRLPGLSSVTKQVDPMELVQIKNGVPTIMTEHKAIISIQDMIARQGIVDGKRLIDHFTDAPYGWSQDTLRYLIAAMLVAGIVTLHISKKEIKVNGQQAYDGLRTNNSFKTIGISLRNERPSNEVLAKASERLCDLTGEQIVPLEDEISKATIQFFPEWQHAYSPISEKLKSLQLPGVEELESLSEEMKNILSSDASDVSRKLGGEESILYSGLKWASEVKLSFQNGLDKTIQDLQTHKEEIEGLPESGIAGNLKNILKEDLNLLQEKLKAKDFFKYNADFSSSLTHLKSKMSDTVVQIFEEEKIRIQEAQKTMSRGSEWSELTLQEQSNALEELDMLSVAVPNDLTGLKLLINNGYTIHNKVTELTSNVQKIAQERLQKKLLQEREKAKEEGSNTIFRSIDFEKKITSLSHLDELIKELQKIRSELQYAHEFELVLQSENGSEESK